MTKKIAIISQPRYLPALNYLQRLYFADVFVIYDVVQREVRGFENRNKLLLPKPKWLTIPVSSSSREKIYKSYVKETDWIKTHKNIIRSYYSKSSFYSNDLLERAYKIDSKTNSLTDILIILIKNACDLLSIKPNIVKASNLLDPSELNLRGIELLKKVFIKTKANTYISGPNGRNYGVTEKFSEANLNFLYHDFIYPVYNQNSERFTPFMGYLDAIFFAGLKWTTSQIKNKNFQFHEK